MPRGIPNKRSSNDVIDFTIGIDPVMDAIAAGAAMADLLMRRGANARYIDTVVDIAFETAEDAFNTETAALALSSGSFDHMYEWGTIGINKGRTNVRQPHTAPTARLWHHFSEGNGLNRTLAYVYKPSVANVPKPTKAATGMDTDVINSMRDHVFRWKAKVIEEASLVTIRPTEAEFLLIPAYEQNRPYMRPHDIKRGYMLTKGPIQANPGNSTESFAAWWLNFWTGQGDEIVESSVQTQILSDLEPELRPKRSSKMIPIRTFNPNKEIAVKQKAVEKRLEAKARLRAARGAGDDD